jgi:membrane fusion protein (multidrug efflux system)
MTTTATSSLPQTGGSEPREQGPGAVLLAGFPEPAAGEIAADGGLDAAVVEARNEAEVHELLEENEVAVLCLGPELAGERARRLLAEVLERHPAYRGCSVVLAAGAELELFQDLVAADRVYYLTQKPPPRPDVLHILKSGLEAYRSRRSPADEPDDDEAIATHRILKATERTARQTRVELAVAATVEAVEDLALADRGAVLLYDPATDTLWNRGPEAEGEKRESAAAGLVSFVVRTKNAVRLDRVGSDPRYDPEADNDEGPSEERFLAVPITDPASAGRVWGVLVALRSPGRQPFSPAEEESLRRLAEKISPTYGRFLLQAEIEERTARRHGFWGSEAGRIFREEALTHHVRGLDDRGRLLRIAPGWTTWAYRLLLVVFATAVVFASVGSIPEYASGPAVVRLEGQTDVTAKITGTVESVEVRPGQRVAAGELLARLYGAAEEAELVRARRELELGLANRLRHPADPGAAQVLVGLRLQRQIAEKRLEERSVAAPHSGTVGDVWIQRGQHLTPGQVVLSLHRDGADRRLSIVALLSGHARPLVAPGMSLRLELQGYSYVYQQLTVESVGEESVGPAEARRFLGPGIGDAVGLDGPVFVVTARLPSPTFEVGGRTYAYHDGILGRAEVEVRSERILLALVPGLKALWNRADG